VQKRLNQICKNVLSNYNDSKRMGMKFQLKNLCQKNEIEFLEIDIDKESMLDRSKQRTKEKVGPLKNNMGNIVNL